jgi:hypothetical protein
MLRSNQISLAIVKEYMDKKNDDSDKLADVWNSLLDARGIILEKIVTSEVFTYASGHAELLRILQTN